MTNCLQDCTVVLHFVLGALFLVLCGKYSI
jgi:hypothetical protein